MSRKELGFICGIPTNVAYEIDVGKDYPSPIIAKQIQEVARRNGLAVTLDEIYQNVVIDFERLPSLKKPSHSINRESASPIDPTDSSQSEDTKDEF